MPVRPPRRPASRRTRGQSLGEFAIVVPLLLVIFGGAVQLGIIFAAQNSLTQVDRDTARWASTQLGFNPCSRAATNSPSALVKQADAIARSSALLAYPTST